MRKVACSIIVVHYRHTAYSSGLASLCLHFAIKTEICRSERYYAHFSRRIKESSKNKSAIKKENLLLSGSNNTAKIFILSLLQLRMVQEKFSNRSFDKWACHYTM